MPKSRRERRGHREAALRAFQALGEVVGDVLAQGLALLDGVAVIGGGLSGAHPLFLPAVLEAMRGVCHKADGTVQGRLFSHAYNLEEEGERRAFTASEVRGIRVPGSGREILYDPSLRTAVGISRLGTSEAVAVGAYAFALDRLEGGGGAA